MLTIGLLILQVIAVNAEGESEPLESVDGFVTENPFGSPGAAGKPECVGGDFDHFEMKWEAPKNDGGSKITSYLMEARLWKDSTWFRAGEDKLVMCKAEAKAHFEVGQHYAVRVRAVNAAGAGPWSFESDQLVCRYHALKPKVTFREVVSKEVITFKAGESLAFEVDIQGEPQAHEIVWSLAGNQLHEAPGNGVVIDNSKPYRSLLVKDDLTRKDEGVLSCTATNMVGKSSSNIEIKVVAKPSMPEDRLLVSNVSRGGCRLTWQPAKDNGGQHLEYVIEKFVAQSDSWSVHVRLHHFFERTRRFAIFRRSRSEFIILRIPMTENGSIPYEKLPIWWYKIWYKI
jgi:hypothetical protein